MKNTIRSQATYPIPCSVLYITCPLIIRGRRSIWISYEEDMSILSCCRNQYRPSLIQSSTHTILPPKGPRVLCRCFRPRPRRCLPETTDLPDAQSKSTMQHSSTDPAHFYIPYSQNCPPSSNSPHSDGKTPAPTCVHDDPRACVPLVLGPVKEGPLLRMEARHPGVDSARVREMPREGGPYLSTPNNISDVFYPGVYPIRMARGKIARTYWSAWFDISFSAVPSPSRAGPGEGGSRTRLRSLSSRTRVGSLPSS